MSVRFPGLKLCPSPWFTLIVEQLKGIVKHDKAHIISNNLFCCLYAVKSWFSQVS